MRPHTSSRWAPHRRSSYVRAVPNDTLHVPLSSWARPVVVAAALAYRTVLGERGEAMEAYRAATAAFLAAGGDPEAEAARDHPEWF